MTVGGGKAAHGVLRRFAGSLPVLALVLLASVLRAQSPPPTDCPPDLAAWLATQPAVSAALVCESAEGARPYKDWSREQKDRLRAAFEKAWRDEPSGLADPLPNAIPVGANGSFRQGLSEPDAMALYFATVGSCLAFELRHAAPWTITRYHPDELAVLLDSREMFSRTMLAKGAGPLVYEIHSNLCGDSVPAAPDVCLAFIRRHGMIGANAFGTVSRLLDWCTGLIHFTGSQTPDNMRAHWQYAGLVPVSRVIGGTYYDDGKGRKSDVISHYTAGCHGTTGFLRSVLRCVNIPVVNRHAAGHSQPYFPTLGQSLSHGDDPYSLLFRSIQPMPAGSRLFIGPARYEQWFGAAVAPEKVKTNVSARLKELAVENLPVWFLGDYLEDQEQGKGHADGLIARELACIGSVEQLEALNLWTRMDARIAELGGADKVRALKKQLLEATNNHTPE